MGFNVRTSLICQWCELHDGSLHTGRRFPQFCVLVTFKGYKHNTLSSLICVINVFSITFSFNNQQHNKLNLVFVPLANFCGVNTLISNAKNLSKVWETVWFTPVSDEPGHRLGCPASKNRAFPVTPRSLWRFGGCRAQRLQGWAWLASLPFPHVLWMHPHDASRVPMEITYLQQPVQPWLAAAWLGPCFYETVL